MHTRAVVVAAAITTAAVIEKWQTNIAEEQAPENQTFGQRNNDDGEGTLFPFAIVCLCQ